MNETLEKDTISDLDIEKKYTFTFETTTSLNEENVDEHEEKNPAEDEQDEKTLNFEDAKEICTALVEVKERRLLSAQTMFKKSIRVSLKSFLISLSLSFLNLFI